MSAVRLIRTGSGVAAASAALIMLAGTPAAASSAFCGAGRGLAASTAVQRAIGDAQISAQSVGFFGACALTAEPQIFESFNDPNFGHIFRAQVTVTCQR